MYSRRVGFLFPIPVADRHARYLETGAARGVLSASRRPLKITLHVTLLLFLISGTYNAIKNWPIYTRNPAIMHGLFGLHLLLGLGGITILTIMLAGREPRPQRANWARGALIALLLAVAAASTLKAAREWTSAHPAPASPARSGTGGS